MNINKTFNLIEFQKLEKFITFYSIEKEFPKDLFFYENQIIFLVENILLVNDLKPIFNENIIQLIFNFYKKLKNKELFRLLIIKLNKNYLLFY